MEKIVLNRLLHHCKQNDIIPINQAGLEKERCTTDYLVKLTSNIEKQFAKRKSISAIFCYVKKAWDNEWHARLLFKLKTNIGITVSPYKYIKSFLVERSICTRVGEVY